MRLSALSWKPLPLVAAGVALLAAIGAGVALLALSVGGDDGPPPAPPFTGMPTPVPAFDVASVAGEPRFVVRVDAVSNTVVLGRRRDLETRLVHLEEASFIADLPPAGRAGAGWRPFRAQARIRHRGSLVDATVRPATVGEPALGGHWTVELDAPVWAAAPGQACVLYDGDTCLGGGRIAAAGPAEPAEPTGEREERRGDAAPADAAAVG